MTKPTKIASVPRRPKPPKPVSLTVSSTDGLTITLGPEPAEVLPFTPKPKA